ncbi:MAG TPA: HD domain-containing protein [Acidimicrobiales bacterium]|nr:HD domain-containing protein [Acidimicrobiales bacterium]
MTVAFSRAEEVIDYLSSLGATASDEGGPFTELDHGLQTAAVLERTNPGDEELQVAGLLHDLAHPWDGPGQPVHHHLGAEAVRPLYGDRIARLIEGHVPAKRYLVSVDPSYRQALSSTSTSTLAAQGGDLTPDEVAAFAADPDLDALLALRRADDQAKVPGAAVPGLEHWEPVLRRLAAR